MEGGAGNGAADVFKRLAKTSARYRHLRRAGGDRAPCAPPNPRMAAAAVPIAMPRPRPTLREVTAVRKIPPGAGRTTPLAFDVRQVRTTPFTLDRSLSIASEAIAKA